MRSSPPHLPRRGRGHGAGRGLQRWRRRRGRAHGGAADGAHPRRRPTCRPCRPACRPSCSPWAWRRATRCPTRSSCGPAWSTTRWPTAAGCPTSRCPVRWEVAADDALRRHRGLGRRGGRAGAGPLGARRRLGPRARHWYWYRFSVGERDQPGGPHPHRPGRRGEVDAAALRLRLLPELPGRLLDRARPPRRRGHRPGGVPRRLHLRGAARSPAPCAPTRARRRSTWPATGGATASTRPTRRCRPSHAQVPVGLHVGRPRGAEQLRRRRARRRRRGRRPGEFGERRAAAYQAYYEHMPVRIEPPDGADVTPVPLGGLGRPGAVLRARRPPVPQRPGVRGADATSA